MKLSTKGRYGVKAMVELAINYGSEPISIKTISTRQHISECYLEQLFAPLRKAGLIKSIRGAQGGYVLNREPKDINVADIMAVVEGPIEISDCLDEDPNCGNTDCCATRLLWEKLKKSIDEVMASVTLQDIVDDYKRIKYKNEELKFINKGE
ncbi:MAG: Rrf2 family transcriptional regulator [Clostridium sp.]|uniref:RrF2 family transcriptional regulator n=1 Tax=Clostridium sp. DSM 8431 TaxID=1761781 RepID=UPI0008F0A611|nr:Rrf2 family transcriptional regulator [Clostridium sp. DSM 8431]MCR4944303.1 Rrf2 family transcriptional regulator [Clostridium sp.]SFU45934.1 transcriptional regulator, BadM/Rrf2 family [Clostridium sp. DSM 8431]